jgi:hypothetical protein
MCSSIRRPNEPCFVLFSGGTVSKNGWANRMTWVDLNLEAWVLFVFDDFALLLSAMGSPDQFIVEFGGKSIAKSINSIETKDTVR